jgi:hypothetical protein
LKAKQHCPTYGWKKNPQTTLTLSAHEHISLLQQRQKYQQSQNNPNNPVHKGTRASSRQGKATHKDDTNKISRRHHLDIKATLIKPTRKYQDTTNNKKRLYDWLGKTPLGQRHAKIVKADRDKPTTIGAYQEHTREELRGPKIICPEESQQTSNPIQKSRNKNFSLQLG